MKSFSFKRTGQKLLAGFLAGAFVAFDAGCADAQQVMLPQQSRFNLDNIMQQVNAQVQNLPDLIFTFSYIAGASFTGFGIISAKKHVDNPLREPLSNTVGKLGVGLALLALPSVSEIMVNTLGMESSGEAVNHVKGGHYGSEFVPVDQRPAQVVPVQPRTK